MGRSHEVRRVRAARMLAASSAVSSRITRSVRGSTLGAAMLGTASADRR
jgi:hypothetical protein